jgi:hypothetical protein
MEVLGAPVDRALAGVRAVAATAASLTEQYAALHDAPANPDAREAVAAAAQRYEEQSAALQAALLAIEDEQAKAAAAAAAAAAEEEEVRDAALLSVRDELRAQVRERNGVMKLLIDKMRRLHGVLGVVNGTVATASAGEPPLAPGGGAPATAAAAASGGMWAGNVVPQ